MDTEEAQEYLRSLLNKNLRVFTTDGRLFWGSLKCTDPVRITLLPRGQRTSPPLCFLLTCCLDQDSNVVLAHTYEYRQPSADALRQLAGEAGGSMIPAAMSSRYLGLVVVPGHHIVKMELEQFASQVATRDRPR
ncbi:LSM domain-containing protein [Drechmeria coniospora]|uniref:LSM domain-containing protein n=1 Tax=Drechmeria coniospora TaxID=98403 RepID=A0A151GC22_DRECN|nr:LSM domain-containing protein [Drechmeria coniospora]KYK54657.1 LSM domain-containing protein [Drechmeria coniospora]